RSRPGEDRGCVESVDARSPGLGDAPARPRWLRVGMAVTAAESERGVTAAADEDRWFAREIADVVNALESDAEHGLTKAEAAERLSRYGPNQIEAEKPPSVAAVALAQ